ncbi:DinB/UmuC family translesion DNA polymerase [Streptomyces sp. 8N616]|uniref:DinB/UmuC family translesion DNA polymerase n=1 Tax=Streptomyces sp. 8N616 TaxID=3457414 RepID=UPI003FD1C372
MGTGRKRALLHVRCRPGTEEALYRMLFDLLRETTPLVQALPAAAALADLDPALIQTALLDMAVVLGERLRTRHQTARALTLTLTFADRSNLVRSRALLEASARTETSASPSTPPSARSGCSAPCPRRHAPR